MKSPAIPQKSQNRSFDDNELFRAISLLKAIDNQYRIQILNHLSNHDFAFVYEIEKVIQQDQSHTSQYLKILKAEDLVYSTRKGKFIQYSINSYKYNKIIETLSFFNAK